MDYNESDKESVNDNVAKLSLSKFSNLISVCFSGKKPVRLPDYPATAL